MHDSGIGSPVTALGAMQKFLLVLCVVVQV